VLSTANGDPARYIGIADVSSPPGYHKCADVDWLPERDLPEEPSDCRRLRWSADGAHIIAYGRGRLEIREVATGAVLLRQEDAGVVPDPRGERLIDPVTRWADAPVQLREVRHGAVLVELEKCGYEGAVWSADGGRLAVLYGDRVDLLDISSLETKSLPVQPFIPDSEAYFDFLESAAWAFSGDGLRAAVFTSPAAVEIWSLEPPVRLQTLSVHEGALGIALDATGETLVAWSRERLEFRSVADGRCLSQLDLNSPRHQGFLTDGGSPLVHAAGNHGDIARPNAAFAVPDGEGQAWITALPGGLIVCPERLRGALETEVSFVIDGRHAWPVHWAEGTEHVEICADWMEALESVRLPADLPEPLRRWHRGERPPTPPSLTGTTETTIEGETFSHRAPTRGPGRYRAVDILSGDAITAEALRPRVGEVVVWREWGRRRVDALLAVRGGDALLRRGTRGHSTSGLAHLGWIGRAEPIADARALPLPAGPDRSLTGQAVAVGGVLQRCVETEDDLLYEDLTRDELAAMIAEAGGRLVPLEAATLLIAGSGAEAEIARADELGIDVGPIEQFFPLL